MQWKNFSSSGASIQLCLRKEFNLSSSSAWTIHERTTMAVVPLSVSTRTGWNFARQCASTSKTMMALSMIFSLSWLEIVCKSDSHELIWSPNRLPTSLNRQIRGLSLNCHAVSKTGTDRAIIFKSAKQFSKLLKIRQIRICQAVSKIATDKAAIFNCHE